VKDDALYRRYRRLIVKPSLRKDATQKVFVIALLFCVALAVFCFAFSLHLITKAGGPWWISVIGCGSGAVLSCVFWFGLPLLSKGAPWYGRLLRYVLIFLGFLAMNSLEYWVEPESRYSFGFEIGLFLSLAAGAFPLLPFPILLPFDSPSGDVGATPPA
jgi:hypothetical protein